MPPPPAGRESIPLDEMMRKLRESERQKDEQGKIVTRSDGSTARRVRRRKRRSEQKQKKTKEEASRKSILFKAVIAVGLFLFLLMGGLFTLVSFNSDRYEEKVEARVGEWIGAEVDIRSHKVLPGSIAADGITLVWPENSHLSGLRLNKLEGGINFRSLLGARLGGQYFGGASGTLVVRSPETAGDLVADIPSSEFPFDFNRYYCDLLDVQFGESGGLALRGAETSLRHFTNEGFRVTVGGGQLSLAGWEDFEIKNALLRFSNGEVKLDPVRVMTFTDSTYSTGSSMTITGSIPLKQGETAQLDLEMSDFPFNVIAGTQMGSLFSGTIRETKEGVAHYTTGNSNLDSVVLPFQGDDFMLERFPVVEGLKKIIFEDVDEELSFDSDISGLLRWSPRGTSVENLEMANKNIRVEGGLVVSSAGKIRGKITLWISMGFINDKPKLRSHPAFARRGGEGNSYAVIDVNLMGTTKLPDDDFGKTIGLAPMKDRLDQNSGKTAEELWKELEGE
ncbi:MAG: hypothetical protein ACON5H_06065 [Akkermansiaceae bacterium]